MSRIYGISFIGLTQIAFFNLRVNLLRSLLAVLGMVFGTAAVIATLSSNEGSKQFIQQELKKLGTNILSVDSKTLPLDAKDASVIAKYSDLF